MKLKLLGLGLLCASTLAIQAGPMERSQIAGNANWFVHLDVDQLKASKFGQFILEQLKKPEEQQKIAAFEGLFNFDPTKALHGLTIYGPGNNPDDGVMLVSGDFDTNRLVSLAKAGKQYEALQIHGHTVHSWIDENKPKKPRTYGALAKGLVVFGQRAERVAGALDVIAGTEASLKGSQSFTDLGIANKPAILVGAAKDTSVPDGQPAAAILKHMKSLALLAYEENGQMQVELPMIASNEDSAHQILTMGQGLVALMSLQNDPGAAKLSQGLTLNQTGNKVVTTLRLQVADMIQLIQDSEKKKKNP